MKACSTADPLGAIPNTPAPRPSSTQRSAALSISSHHSNSSLAAHPNAAAAGGTKTGSLSTSLPKSTKSGLDVADTLGSAPTTPPPKPLSVQTESKKSTNDQLFGAAPNKPPPRPSSMQNNTAVAAPPSSTGSAAGTNASSNDSYLTSAIKERNETNKSSPNDDQELALMLLKKREAEFTEYKPLT